MKVRKNKQYGRQKVSAKWVIWKSGEQNIWKIYIK